MASGIGVALGAVLNTVGDALAQKREKEYKEEQDRLKGVRDIVSKAIESGTLENPQQAFQFLLDQNGKGKGKGKKGELPGPLKNIIGATMQAGQGSSNMPVFSTPDQLSARDAKAAGQKAGATTSATIEAKRDEAKKMLERGDVKSLDEGLERVGLKEPVPKAPPSAGSLAADVLDAISVAETEKGSPLDPAERQKLVGEVRGRRAKETRPDPGDKMPTGQVGQVIQRKLGVIGKTWETATPAQREVAQRGAAAELEATQQATVEKRTTLMKKTLIEIQRDQTSLDLLKQTAPLTLKLKELGVQLDEKRLAAAAKNAVRNPAPMLEAARKAAQTTMAQKQKNKAWYTRLTETLFGGSDPTEDELVDKYVQEWTGQDAQTLRDEAAKQYVTPSSNPANRPSSTPPTVFPKDANGNYLISAP